MLFIKILHFINIFEFHKSNKSLIQLLHYLIVQNLLAWVGILVLSSQTAYEVATISVERVWRRTSYTVRGSRYSGWSARVTRRGWRATTRRRRVSASSRYRAQAFRLHVGRGRHFVIVVGTGCVIVIYRVLDLHTDPRASALRQTK